MSSDIVIAVNNLSKCYRIFDSPQDRLKQGLWFGRKNFYKEFWALRNVSFEVKKGETLGIIGVNGSGKSTLLQIIAGTVNPTMGEVKVNGRVAALLELGSGFNPEFTGRENVFLNGSIMGLSKEFIEKRFDDITTFADIGEFINQPVKTYSSGMFVRLAFSIAVHADPDILIVDEALSVGDALFQHRCMAKIKNLVKKGVTLLFVSHSPEAMRSLCKYGIWLQDGQTRMIDEAVKVSNAYLNEIFLEYNRVVANQIVSEDSFLNKSKEDNTLIEHAKNNITNHDSIIVHYVRIKNSKSLVVESLEQGESFLVEVQLSSKMEISDFSVGVVIKDEFGLDLIGESIFNKYKKGITLKPNEILNVVFKSKLILRGGQTYSVNLRLNKVSKWDRSDNIHLYNDETAAVFKVIADINQPMWFKFDHHFEVDIDVK